MAGWFVRTYPYGDARSGTMATDRRFTVQREETAIGLYDYAHHTTMGPARYYDPVLGRFIEADTGNQKNDCTGNQKNDCSAPEPGNPQSLNRYAYVYGNLLRYTDPTGYYSEDGIMQAFDVETWDKNYVPDCQMAEVVGARCGVPSRTQALGLMKRCDPPGDGVSVWVGRWSVLDGSKRLVKAGPRHSL